MTRKTAALAVLLCLLGGIIALADINYTLELSHNYIKLDPGATQKVSVAITPQNLIEHSISWNSDNPYVASVSQKGVISAHAAGTTRISATIETGTSKYLTVVVNGNPVRSLAIADSDIQLEIGQSARLEYIIDTTADDQRVIWSSSDEAVAKVSNDGIVSAISGGTATITLTAVNGLTATAEVYVPSDVKRIEFKPDKVYVGLGDTLQLEAYVYPGNARGRELQYLSSNPLVAQVDANGMVTGISEGVCIVKAASSNGVFALANVHVSRLPRQLSITRPKVALSKTSRFTQLEVECIPPEAQGCELVWQSSNDKVVSVSGGKLSANGYGTATVTATALNGIMAECLVYVCEPPAGVSFESSLYSLRLDGAPLGTSIRFTPEDSYAEGGVYSIDNPNIASIDSNGVLTPISPGQCTLKLSYPFGISASTRITVYENVTGLFLKNEHVYMTAGSVQPLIVYTNSGNVYLSALSSGGDSNAVAYYSGGYLFAKAEGTALITLRSLTGNLSCSVAVTVYPASEAEYKHIALTFDNGPCENTADIINVLKDYGVNATFFMLGRSVERYPEYAMLFKDTAFELGNHTYSNISVNLQSLREAALEIERTDRLILDMTGRKPTLLRAPDARLPASITDSFLDTRRFVSRGLQLNNSYSSASADSIVESALAGCYDNAILTLHDCGENTVEALKVLIPELMLRSYRFVTVSELIELTGSKAGVFSTSK